MKDIKKKNGSYSVSIKADKYGTEMLTRCNNNMSVGQTINKHLALLMIKALSEYIKTDDNE